MATPIPHGSSGWGSLLSYRDEVAEAALDERARIADPVECPNDGEPLREAGDGSGLFCPFDGWQPGFLAS